MWRSCPLGVDAWGRQTQNIQNSRLVIAIPAIVQESALRLPSLPHGRCTAARPLPIDAAVDRIGAFADLVLVWRVLAEIDGSGQHAREKQRCVDQRHFTPPDALAGLHVEEVVIETLIAGRVRLVRLAAVPKKAQGDQRACRCVRTRHPSALHSNRITRQREAYDGDAGGRAGPAGIGHQAVLRVELLHKIAERRALKPIQQFLIRLGGRFSHDRSGFEFDLHLLQSSSTRGRAGHLEWRAAFGRTPAVGIRRRIVVASGIALVTP